jgi:hypothetical protein
MSDYNPLTNPIDYIVLEGEKSPGLADVEADSPRKWEEQEPFAMAASFLRGGGRRLSHPKVTLRLYTDEHWAAWNAWKRLIKPLPAGLIQVPSKFAHGIWHPWLEDVDVKAVVIANVSTPKPIDDGTAFAIEISMIEFRVPKISFAAPSASKQDAAAPDPVEQRMKDLADKVQAEKMAFP